MKPDSYRPKHFLWQFDGCVATITLNRPEKKNPITFESYAELRDLFRELGDTPDVRSVVITGAGGNFSSGGDVHEIIGPLTRMSPDELQKFTAMTGDLILAMVQCPQVIIAAIDGICVGAGACIAMASDLRVGTAESRVGFIFVRVGLGGCDMGACALLPRIIGHGRAAELLYSGRVMDGDEAERVGFFTGLYASKELLDQATSIAGRIAGGPIQAHRMTKRMLVEEWDIPLAEAVRAEAVAQAALMSTRDFRRAYEAFVKREPPRFEGN